MINLRRWQVAPLWALLSLFVAIGASDAVFTPVANAAELHQEFLDGLRARGFYDEALYYLDTLEQNTTLDADLKKRLPYERGLTLLKNAQTMRNPEAQEAALDQAAGQLETFVRENPNHALVGKAQAERGNILLGKARVKIWDANSPVNEDKKPQLQQEARKDVLAARKIFQSAHDKYKEVYEGFPKFIPADEKEQRATRQKAEIDYMQAQIDLAMCTYEEAQTYTDGSDEFKKKLTEAANAFEAIHQKYRSMVGGLYARMWQGKCFEEQDDIGKALGIYNELLEHGKDKATVSRSLRVLQDQVRHFRLICLNHRSRADYQLVVDESGEWLSDSSNRILARTPTGLGIRYQKALAHESLANKLRQEEQPEKVVEQQLRLALKEAQELTRWTGQYKDVAQFMAQRLKASLNINPSDPKSFDEAFGLAKVRIKKIGEFEDDINQAKAKKLPAAEVRQREDLLEAHLDETAKMLQLGLQLADSSVDARQINLARYLLAFVYYKMDRSLEAGVMTEFIANRYAREEPEMARDAAKIAMAAYVKAYNEAAAKPKDENGNEADVSFELDQLLRVCQMIIDRFPESGLADDSRMTVGRIYMRRDVPEEAAKWFGAVPVSSTKHYASAQISAGEAYWNAYLKALRKSAEERPDEKTLTEWQNKAQNYLKTGIEKVEASTPKDAPPEKLADLIAAKVTRGQIFVNQQKFKEAIGLVTSEPHAPVKAIQIAEDKPRPKVGVQSKAFASVVYQLLLRAYVGTQQIDEAQDTMKKLEATVGEGGGSEVTQIYVQLGRQIQEELDRTKIAGPPEKFNQILNSFSQFLDALYQKRNDAGTSYGALQWIAETYLALGETAEGAKATEYFNRSAETYQMILDKAAKDSKPPQGITGIKLRLGQVYQAAGQFEKGYEKLKELVKELPNAIEVQIAVAELLQAWGASSRPDTLQYLMKGIGGDKEAGVWGWQGIAQRIGQQLRSNEEAKARFNQELQKIYAAENTAKILEKRQLEYETIKAGDASTEEIQPVEERLKTVTDAIAVTEKWQELGDQLAALQSAPTGSADAEKKRAAQIEALNRKIEGLVTSDPEGSATYRRIQKHKATVENLVGEATLRLLQQQQHTVEEISAALELGRAVWAIDGAIDQLEFDDLVKVVSADPGAPYMITDKGQQHLDKLKSVATPAEIQAAVQEVQVLRDAINSPLADVDRKPELLQNLTQIEAKSELPREQMLNSLYQIAISRQTYADQQSSSDAKKNQLEIAASELGNLPLFVNIEQVDSEWLAKFNSLYRDVQKAADPNATPQVITKVAEVKSDPTWIETPTIVPETIVEAESTDGDSADAEETQPEGPSMVFIILGLLVALGATGGTMFFLMKGSKRPARRPSYAAAEPVFGAGGATAPATKTRKRSGATKKAAAPPQKSAAAPKKAASQKPAPTRKPAEGQAPRKKRPAPPRSSDAGAAPKPQAKPRPKPRPKPPTDDA
ncbi:hypothetical protein [Thalassoroseus pseudoceratinae]|uniref:hypothetical protein n=1 Tax=Thalassoroseus pseudoceratinae TaxID=2713176 RepID=UPI001423F9B0|nr:hypothetical protein [Thalassoroseus pseudoceratinae]